MIIYNKNDDYKLNIMSSNNKESLITFLGVFINRNSVDLGFDKNLISYYRKPNYVYILKNLSRVEENIVKRFPNDWEKAKESLKILVSWIWLNWYEKSIWILQDLKKQDNNKDDLIDYIASFGMWKDMSFNNKPNLENSIIEASKVISNVWASFNNLDISSSTKNILNSNQNNFKIDEKTWEIDLVEAISFWSYGKISLSDDKKSFILEWYGYKIKTQDKSLDSLVDVVRKTDSINFIEQTGLYTLWWDLEKFFFLVHKLNATEDISIENWYLSLADKRLLLKTLSENMNIINYDQNNLDKKLVYKESSPEKSI